MPTQPSSANRVSIAAQATIYRPLFKNGVTVAVAFPAPMFSATPTPMTQGGIDLTKPIGTTSGTIGAASGLNPKTGVMQYVDTLRALAIIPRGNATQLMLTPLVTQNAATGETGAMAVMRIHKAINDPDATANLTLTAADLLRTLAFAIGGFQVNFQHTNPGNAFGLASNEIAGATTFLANSITEVTPGAAPIPPDGWIFNQAYTGGAGEIAIDGHGCDYFAVLMKTTTAASVNALFALE